MVNCWDDVIEKRRSIYDLGKKEVIPYDKLVNLVKHKVMHCPSAFNSQSARVVVLFENAHLRLWGMVYNALREIVPQNKFAPTEAKIKSFANGYATILFFEDSSVIAALEKKYPAYAQNFAVWAQQSNGMLQYMVWTAVEAQGAGANLQHYNELIKDNVLEEWNLPQSWKLIAQMPVGSMETSADVKSFENIEKRVKVFK